MKFFKWLPDKPQVSLEKHRVAINNIDFQLIELLGYRFHHIKQISQIKKLHNLPIQDKEREAQIQKNIELLLHLHNLPVEQEINTIFESIINESKKYQKKLNQNIKPMPQKKSSRN
jgi:chorismate mutase